MPRPANPYDDLEIMGSTNPDTFAPAIAVGNNVGGRPTAVVAAPGSEGRRQAERAADFAAVNRVPRRAQAVTARRGTRSSRPTSTTPRNRVQQAREGVRQAARRVGSVAERGFNRVRGRRGRRR